MWNDGHNTQKVLSISQKLAGSLTNKGLSAATEAFSLFNHYLSTTCERVNERVDFFADALQSGKTEAILLLKYLPEEDQLYKSSLYRNINTKFAELRSQAYAKESNKQITTSSSTGRRIKGSSSQAGSSSRRPAPSSGPSAKKVTN